MMATRAGVGLSTQRHPERAAEEAVQKAISEAGIEKPDFVFLFATVGYPQETLLRAVRAATKSAPLVGCSGEGVITNNESIETGFAVLVAVLQSDEIRFDTALATGLKSDPVKTGSALGDALSSRVQDDSFALFVFPDGLTINFDRFYSGLEEGLRVSRFLPLLGGTAGDAWDFAKTYQYCNDTIVSDGVSAVLMSGKGRIASTHTHGAVPIGNERKITKSDKNVICEIDDKPALDVLKEYLNFEEHENWAKAIVNLTLGFKTAGELSKVDEFYIRYIPEKDDEKGTVTIPTEVAPGTSVWMTRRDHDKISEGVERACDRLRMSFAGNKPKLMFHFDCAGRGNLIFRQDQKVAIIQRLQKDMGEDVPWVGFHSYGEIGPVGKKNHFHNHTLVLAGIY